MEFVREDISEDEVVRRRAAIEPLTDTVRDLIDAVIRTEVSDDVIAEARRRVDDIVAMPQAVAAQAKDGDVVITMGCGDACPIFPGKRYEDWQLDDPAGQGVEAVRPIRDEIRGRVQELLASLGMDA